MCIHTVKYPHCQSATFNHQYLHECLSVSWLASAKENGLLSVVIYTFLSSADINVSNPVVVMPLPYFLPNLHSVLAQLLVLVSVKVFFSISGYTPLYTTLFR